MALKKHTVVIGGGPGGYVAAIRASQLGLDTLVIEKGNLGGVCLNVGCIPSKAVIHAAKTYYKSVHENETMGIEAEKVSLDFGRTIAWKDSVVSKLTGGIGGLLKGNKVDVLNGTATFTGPKKLSVTLADGKTETVEFENCILATGSSPISLPAFPIDQEKILDSTGALALKKLPESLIVIGGGYIGLELGMAYAKLGTKVTVVEFLDSVLAQFDADVVQVVEKKLKKLGVTVLTSTKADGFTKKGSKVVLKATDKAGKNHELEADYIFVSIGRSPNSKNLGLDKAGIQVDEKGFVKINERCQTSAKHIYAIGDVAGQPMLAHKASKEGEIAAENIAGHKAVMDCRQIPAVVFTDPEISQSGMSEKEARASGRKFTASKFPYAAIGRSLTTNETEGFVKFISDSETKEVLGITIVGANASDLISEAALAIEMCAFVDDVALTVHPHPTFGEILMEAAKGNLGEAIHVLNPKH